MKIFIAVVKHENNRVTKYQDFDTQAEADAHVATYGGFVDDKPSDRFDYWIVDADKKTLTHDEVSCKRDDAAIVATEYQRDRVPLYGSIGDQLDMQYHDLINGTTTWKDAITKVKTDNPKP